jgi:hypothetical protein
MSFGKAGLGTAVIPSRWARWTPLVSRLWTWGTICLIKGGGAYDTSSLPGQRRFRQMFLLGEEPPGKLGESSGLEVARVIHRFFA